MKTVVFAGPSIFGVDMSRYRALSVRGPAAAGDILAAVRDGVSAIGLIDGLYGDTAAVWHKEILYALSEGIHVAGAASMGALRAAECAAFGMEGIGAIFHDYASGRRVSDADVAVAHAPAELAYQPVSLALVDVEATLELPNLPFSTPQRQSLLQAARSLHFSKRSWRMILAAANIADEERASAIASLSQHHRQAKRQDAVRLLDHLLQPAVASVARSWIFQRTGFFSRLEERLR